MIDFLMSVALLSIELFIYKLFMDTFLVKKIRVPLRDCLVQVGGVIFTWIAVSMFQELFLLKAFCVVAIYTVVWKVYYNVKIHSSLLAFLICYAVCILGSYVGMVFVWVLFPELLESAQYEYIAGYLSGFLCDFISFLFCVIIHLVFRRRDKKVLNIREVFLYITLPLVTIVMLCVLAHNWSIIKNVQELYALTGILIGMVCVNILMFYLIDVSIRQQKMNYDTRLAQQRLEYEWKNYRIVEQNLEEQRKKSHEFRNQITHIVGLYYNKNFEELERYLSLMQLEIDDYTKVVSTNNAIIDVILNTKIKEAMQKNIACSIRVGDLSQSKVEQVDMVVLLSNLFNNAIEASQEAKQKLILFEMNQSKYELIIKMENYMKHSPIMKKGKFITSKSHASLHGFGISNIKDVVEKYSGDYHIEYDDNKFSSLIVIPLL